MKEPLQCSCKPLAAMDSILGVLVVDVVVVVDVDAANAVAYPPALS